LAVLKDPHWESVPSSLQKIFRYIGRQSFSARFYLAGGTALALQLGHRLSVDLDFFSDHDEITPASVKEITTILQEEFSVSLVDAGLGGVLVGVEDSYVGFYHYSYPLLVPTIELEEVELAGLLDIGLMKMDAIAGRGGRKDFYDLYFIAQQIPLEKMFAQGAKKFPYIRQFDMMVLAACVDFTIADEQADVETTPPVMWEDVKAYFSDEARRISRNWFE